jgi:MFS transporter, ACS family, glucarate transporter
MLSSPEIASERPSRARYVVLALLCSLTFILYVDRVCMGQAEQSIRSELGLNKAQMGAVAGSFAIAYSLFEVLTGGWGDRYGSRGVLTRIVVWWSIFTALTGLVPRFSWGAVNLFGEWKLVLDSFVLLLVVRFLFGAGEAGALPNTARVIARWFPLAERGAVHGVTLFFMQAGGAMAPILAARTIEAAGWRWTFAIFGVVGVVWAAVFAWWYRDDPASHPSVNDAERRLIGAAPSRTDAEHPHAPAHAATPWRRVLARREIWLMGFIQSCAAAAAYMYMNWYATYLKEGRGLGEHDAAYCTAFVLGAGATGTLVGGAVSRWIDRRGASLQARVLLAATGLILGGVCLAAGARCDSPYATTAGMAGASFLASSQLAQWWSVITLIGGRHVGALFGLANSLGVAGSFGSPYFLGWFADSREKAGFTGRAVWDPAWDIYAGVLIAGGIVWLFVNPHVRFGDDPPHDSDAV